MLSVTSRSAVFVFLILASSLTAQVAHQVIDIDPRLLHEQSSDPDQITPAGELTYFVAGRQVWATDGSPGDARPLAGAMGHGGSRSKVEFYGLIDERMMFSVETRDGFTNLWSSDGTRANTVLLRTYESLSSTISSNISTVIADGLLYLAREEENRTVIWVTDGTPQGVRDLVTMILGKVDLAKANDRVGILVDRGGLWVTDGTSEGTQQVIENFQSLDLNVVAGRFVFSSDKFNAPKLWSSDGTEAGTVRIGIFASPTISFLTNGNSGLYFAVDQTSTGEEIWLTDGTLGGTRQITDLANPTALSFNDRPPQAEALGNKLIFLAVPGNRSTRQLFVTDGDPVSTRALTDLDPGFLSEFERPTLVRVGNRVVARALVDGFPGENQLWVSNGTRQSTRAITASCSEFDCGMGQHALVPGLDGWVFAQRTPSQGTGIWTTDGSVAGTREVARLSSVPTHSRPWLAMNGDTLYFAASGLNLGTELWRTEGTEESTKLVANMAGQAPASSFPSSAALGDRLLFSACKENQEGLYSTGGTAEDTFFIAGLEIDNCRTRLNHAVEANGHLIFVERLADDFRDQIWSTNGEPGDLRRLTAFPDDEEVSSQVLGKAGNRVFFNVTASFPALPQIWVTDGTEAGTEPSVLSTEFGLRYFRDPQPIGDELMFMVEVGSDIHETWLTDGTVNGTHRLHIQADGPSLDEPFEAEILDGRYYVTVPGTEELYMLRSDGTAETTLPVLGVDGPITSAPIRLRRLGNRLLFFAAGHDVQWGLWSSDGTEEGTHLLADLPRQDGHGFDGQSDVVVLGDRILFAIEDDIHGLEPWISDGTAPGTGLLVDIGPGPGSSRFTNPLVVGERAFFVADDSLTGDEVWTTDGTSSGTKRLADIALGGSSSFPQGLTAVGSDLYFTADDGVSGFELWTVPSADQAVCTDGPARLCLGDGRFQVTINWQDFEGATGDGQAVSLSEDTGAFWFFGPQNLEAMVKIIDGRENNGYFWVFYGSLTNVAFELTVVDAVTGRSAIYTNPIGEFASEGDIQALLATDNQSVFGLQQPTVPPEMDLDATKGGVGDCVADALTLCLGDGRFRARVQWTDFVGATGSGNSVPLTADTGAFWFFGPDNLEVMVKVIDGRDFNGKFWVFYGALTNVAFQLAVEDTVSGASAIYDNSLGSFASRGDIEALPGS